MLGGARVAVVCFALVPPLSCASAEQAEVKQGADFYQDGVHYREVDFGDTVYRLPVDKYQIGISPYNVVRGYASFGFSLILPDLSPVSSDPAEVATWGKGTGFHRELYILVEYGRNFISQQKMIDEAFDESAKYKGAAQRYIASHPESATKFSNTKILTEAITKPYQMDAESMLVSHSPVTF